MLHTAFFLALFLRAPPTATSLTPVATDRVSAAAAESKSKERGLVVPSTLLQQSRYIQAYSGNTNDVYTYDTYLIPNHTNKKKSKTQCTYAVLDCIAPKHILSKTKRNVSRESDLFIQSKNERCSSSVRSVYRAARSRLLSPSFPTFFFRFAAT